MNKDIGNRIKKIRESKNIEPKRVADEVEILPTSLSKIEREGTNSVLTLLKIAKALKVSASEFFEDKQLQVKENKSDYGYATKSELSEVTHALLKLTRAVEKLQEELPKKKAAPKKKYGKG